MPDAAATELAVLWPDAVTDAAPDADAAPLAIPPVASLNTPAIATCLELTADVYCNVPVLPAVARTASAIAKKVSAPVVVLESARSNQVPSWGLDVALIPVPLPVVGSVAASKALAAVLSAPHAARTTSAPSALVVTEAVVTVVLLAASVLALPVSYGAVWSLPRYATTRATATSPAVRVKVRASDVRSSTLYAIKPEPMELAADVLVFPEDCCVATKPQSAGSEKVAVLRYAIAATSRSPDLRCPGYHVIASLDAK